jgi:DNA-binding NarL/FixJ family response regulator
MDPIRVLLVDDHAVLRAGVRAMLQHAQGITIVGEAGGGFDALQLVRELQPHVVLMDLAMPAMNGLEATRHLAEAYPDVRVLILSLYSAEEQVRQALEAGAAGYVLKDADAAELEFAVRAVAGGQTYLTPRVSKQVVVGYLRRGHRERSSEPILTPRQREVLQMIAEGKSTKEIARILNISVKTVETHRTQLMDRLDIHETAGLVRYAMRAGLIPPVT